MSLTNYKTSYTQFKNKFNIPSINTVITRGFLGTVFRYNKIPICVYQILPREGIATPITADVVIKHTDTPTTHSGTIIEYSNWNGITYNFVINHFQKDTINILLYDSATLEKTDILNSLDINEVAILSGTCPIEDICGFAFYGKPNVDLDYYINIFGSKLAVLQRLYSLNFNIINLSETLNITNIRRNPDYAEIESAYIYSPRFTLVISLPSKQESLYINEEELRREYDTTPEEAIAIAEYKNQVLSYQSYKKQYDQSLLDLKTHQIQEQERIRAEAEALYKAELVTLKDKLDKHEQTLRKDVSDRIEELNKEYFSKLQKDVSIRKSELFTTIDKDALAERASRKLILDEYERTERTRIDKEAKHRLEQNNVALAKELKQRRSGVDSEISDYKATIQKKLETEYRLEYTRKYSEEYTSKNHELDGILSYEREQRMRVIIKELDATKLTKERELLVWEIQERKRIQESLKEYETSQRDMYACILETDYQTESLRMDALVKADYLQGLENGKMQVESDISVYREKSFNEINKTSNTLYETRMAHIRQELADIEKQERDGIKQRIEKQKQTLLAELKISEEETRIRTEQIHQELEAFEKQSKIRTDRISKELVEFEKRQRDEIKQTVDRQKEIFLAELKIFEEQSNIKIAERIAYNEQCEIERVIAERSEILSEKMKGIQSEKERTVADAIVLKEIELNGEYAKKTLAVEVEFHKLREEKLSAILFDIELQKTKLQQILEDQHAKHVHEFRTKLADEYSKAQEEHKQTYANALVDLEKNHIEERNAHMAEHAVQLEKDRQKQIEVFNTKLQDEYTRLRMVEKMLLETELADHTTRFKEKVYAEHGEYARRLQESYELQKKQYAERLYEEQLLMEQERIRSHTIELAKFDKQLEAEFCKIKVKTEQALREETELRRVELLQHVSKDVESYKTSLLSRVKSDVETIKQKELEEMRESLYMLAMERVKEKLTMSV